MLKEKIKGVWGFGVLIKIIWGGVAVNENVSGFCKGGWGLSKNINALGSRNGF